MSVAEGQQVGNYRVLQRIGTGGMGAVYLAEHPVIGKRVALKVIHRELASNREVISRFYQEARAVTRIGNEHIVEIHDFGQSPEGDHFFIMEYLDGQTLAQLLARERVLDTPRALHIAAQVADALCAAHATGVIHRDLKPDNVMLCNRLGDPYFVKLLDFGLAKMFDGGARNLTAQGVVLGTPQYMSPEACESKKDIDHRTDIYALGVLLFQMLTGQVPFDGQTMGEVLIKQVMHAPPAPRALNPHIAPSVEQIILRCLAKPPDGRFPTMLALREALLDPDRYLASSPPIMPAAMPTAAAQAVTMFGVTGSHAAVPAPAPTGPGAALPLKPPPSPFSDQPTVMQADRRPGRNTDAKTAIVDAGAMPPRKLSVAPGLVVPQPAQNQTMVIATPPGFKSHPPRKHTGLIIAGVVLVVVGAIVAVVMTTGSGNGSGDGVGAENGSGTGSGSGSGTGSGSGAVVAPVVVDAGPTPDAAPVIELARITITSEPSGAEVFDESGRKVGETPTELGVPADGSEHTLTFRHPKAKERTKTIAATGDMTLSVLLEALPASPSTGDGERPRGGGKGHGKRGSGGGKEPEPQKIDIMEPGF